MNVPNIESVFALDGRDCETLTDEERKILAFYFVYGLHYGVSMGLVSTFESLETGLTGIAFGEEVIRQSTGAIRVGRLSMVESPEQSARRHAHIRDYFETGCLCILAGDIEKKGEAVSDFEASVYYESSCKCSRNYPPFSA